MNKVIKRLDDLVNNNKIYILVIIYIINYNNNIKDLRDDEY